MKSFMPPSDWELATRYVPVAKLTGFEPPLPVHACAYIVGGGTAAGKTTAARAVSIAAELQHVPNRHIEFDEPGTAVSTPATRLFSGDPSIKSSAPASSGRRPTAEDINRYCFNLYLEWWDVEAKGLGAGGILVLDSVWSWLAFASSMLEIPSPKGGVHPAYANAARALDNLAVKHGIAIFAVQNTELFPIPHLEGAAGGQVEPSGGAPVLTVRDRNYRNRRQYVINPEVWTSVQSLRGGV